MVNSNVENKIGYLQGLASCVYRDYVYSMWLDLSLKGISIIDFFEMNNLKDIIIYGYGEVGKKLFRELNKSYKINIVAVLDQKAMEQSDDILILSPEGSIPKHDIMIVTILDCNYVRNTIGNQSNIIVSVDELLRGFFE